MLGLYLKTAVNFLFGLSLAWLIVQNPAAKFGYWLRPQWGFFILSTILLFSIPDIWHPKRLKTLKLSEWIPLAVILLLLIIENNGEPFQLLNAPGLIMGLVSPLATVFLFASVYLFIKANPSALSVPFAVMVVFVTIGIVVTAFSTGLKNGGWTNPANYDVIAPVLISGTLLSPPAWRWWLSGAAVVGVFFSGSEIALGAAAVILVIVLIRKDTSKRLIVPFAALALCILVASPFGVTQKLWIKNDVQAALGERVQAAFSGGDAKKLDYLITGNRLYGNWNIRPVTLLGHGVNIRQLTEDTPHNQVLIMVDQIGIIGAAAWLTASVIRLRKTREWYLWGAVAVIGMVDHFFWTFGATWWWALLAVMPQGLIFKRGDAVPRTS